MSTEHPLRIHLRTWLPEYDFAIMSHGFAPHGRDYLFIVQAAGTYELTLTHVVELHYETGVADEVWPKSWDDRFTNYATAHADGGPDAYVWGNNWSLAYPGLEVPDDDPRAAQWTERLGRRMFAMAVETDRFRLSLIFHEARSRKLSEDSSVIQQALIPL